MRIFQTVRRVIRRIVAGGGNGFIASVIRSGLRVSNRLQLIGARNLLGLALLTTLALSVRTLGIGVESTDTYTIGVRTQVQDNS